MPPFGVSYHNSVYLIPVDLWKKSLIKYWTTLTPSQIRKQRDCLSGKETNNWNIKVKVEYTDWKTEPKTTITFKWKEKMKCHIYYPWLLQLQPNLLKLSPPPLWGGILSVWSHLCLLPPVTQLLHSAKTIAQTQFASASAVPALVIMSPTSPDSSFSREKMVLGEKGIHFSLLTSLSSS